MLFHKKWETLIPFNLTVIQMVLHLLNGSAFQDVGQLKSINLFSNKPDFQFIIETVLR